ncbi:MAG: ATP-binding cassette domain-containing protein [Bacteroidetes bacterium]|nr:ATP-binding cassette domain-containing protein [Bacteroidota bacterium]
MKITLIDVGKRFNRDWIFRHINYEFTDGNSYAIIGSNGSGKSTLLQVIAGAMAESEGKVSFQSSVSSQQPSTLDSQLPTEDFYTQVSIAAPYMELIEEMSLSEFLDFHQIFKPFLPGMNTAKAIEELGLGKSAAKHIRYYSSGMKQRVKLAQAFFSNTPVLLLDEPCTNLDQEGIDLYHRLIKEYCVNRTVIVSSNDEQEYGFCEKRVNIMEYKK